VHSDHAAFVVAASFLFVVALGAVAVIGEIATAVQGIAQGIGS
jgi:hypothetical protein